MVLHSLIIVNKSGGLIYHKYISPSNTTLSTNELLRIGSTFHGLNAITSQIAPVISSGIDSIETDTFTLKCLHTLTGLKFVITASPGTSYQELDSFLLNVYQSYSDFVLKNPFYEVEMPIRCELFNKNLETLARKPGIGGRASISRTTRNI